MAGGLINIVTYGSQDLFLTGNPEITHFKVVYRRYTNFSMESIYVNFEDKVAFGQESHVVLPTVGDLVHKMYLEIIIPQIHFTRVTSSQAIAEKKQIYLNSLINLNKVADFMAMNMSAYREALIEYQATNDTSIDGMKNAILEEFTVVGVGSPSSDLSLEIINAFQTLIAGIFDFSIINLNDIAENLPSTTTKDEFIVIINKAVNASYMVVKHFQDIVNNSYNDYLEVQSTVLQFAWVKKLGHAIIDYIDVYIGGEKIDRHFGDWINIWYELTGNRDQETIYNKLIGNISELTNFDRTVKPSYVMQIPLQFWFCRFNGLALPLVALENNDVSITMKLKKFEHCAYVENDPATGGNLNDYFDNNNLFIESRLLIDYIYLDGPERRKFAQSAHEYLIDQIQFIFLEDIAQEKIPIRLDFNHPTKEIVWVIQRNSFVSNPDGTQECKWWNYGVNSDGSLNPVLNAQILFNGYERVSDFGPGYFNYVQPYYAHGNSPVDGVNMYSFGIKPEEQQPSGSCNFTRLANALINLTVSPSLYPILSSGEQDTVNVRMYGVNYNVLRIIGGMATLAFA